ncbi:AAA family ATPase [Tenacibaculum finnmarkense genomovar ulcerans]|uniref:AAA family ATPase n=1 Tax=Tenacibaculum finnmarkense TaxID=2781243 RepID=UPI001E512B64|nr:ATP-binding protein [Tenacibaculum finnmarkense]MCD8433564.1 AAA family ATPase [Tenacibaculum finnmarkense genomovar ulcerans]MCD8445568.1 AAA family ATPase [Tenacibaculum finnmarkense genomovar ulcerans]MCG8808901.1 AAA family ATPase [Tenacibaculum finnmarkense]MCG8819143.1 AAA family ATPase [Tenacibaculum finnmarkense]
MRIKNLTFLNNYKQFEKGHKFSFSSSDGLNDLSLSVLVGRNGSGKTTLMSLIATLFHNLERYGHRIPADFEITYRKHFKEKEFEVTIKHLNNLVTISILDVFKNIQLMPKRNARENYTSLIDKKKKFITYEDIKSYLPNKVVTSSFSIHGEYPTPRPYNYIGDELVSIQTITNIYGNNHYDFGSISIGIFRFVNLFFDGSNKIKDLLTLFDLKFTNRVLFSQTEDWDIVNRKWIKKNTTIIQEKQDYLNDIEFERNGRLITLSNMSSGEKMLLLRIISILNSIEQNSLIIIEEPELHLDPVWNRQLITLFQVILAGYNSHLLIATHNYSIINSVQQSNLVYLQDGAQNEISENTFLASYEELFRVLYGENFKSNTVEEEFLSALSKKNITELKNDYDRIGNSLYKYLIYKKIKEKS